MPRKKHPFINRANAKTYQLVPDRGEGSEENTPVLVPVQPSASSSDPANSSDARENISSPAEGVDGESLLASYRKADFEFGDIGLPNDGYDYAKHFKTIGGGGGVFMDAATGLPNPEAVTGRSSDARSAPLNSKDGVVLKEEAEKADSGGMKRETWRRKEDIIQHQKAIEAIKLERQKKKDIDVVFAALESDVELDSGNAEHNTLDLEQFLVKDSDDDGILPDDFITIAGITMNNGNAQKGKFDGILEQYREPRLLDQQFEIFMKGYEFPDNDEEEEYFPSTDLPETDDLTDFQAHMTTEEREALGEDFLKDFSGLKVSEGDVKVDDSSTTQHGNQDDDISALNDSSEDVLKRAAEYQEFADAEFERGMTGLLESYNRVSAVDALDAIEGVDVALEAMARVEAEELAKIEQRVKDGLDEDSDGHDSELESKFDEMFKQPDEKWDCESIISTYTNLENHPSVIDAPVGRKRRPVQKQAVIRLDPRTQAPADYMPTLGVVSGAGPADFGSRREGARDIQARSRSESKEEKKARKLAVKEAARERRALKSEMKKAFGFEHVKQSRHASAMGTSKVAVQF